MRISDWSSDVCSSDLLFMQQRRQYFRVPAAAGCIFDDGLVRLHPEEGERFGRMAIGVAGDIGGGAAGRGDGGGDRSDERRVGTECVSTCSSWWSTGP